MKDRRGKHSKRTIERGYDKNMNKMSMRNPNGIHKVWTILSLSLPLYVLLIPLLLLLLFWIENSLCERALSSDFNLDKYKVTKIHQIDNLCIRCTVYSVQCAHTLCKSSPNRIDNNDDIGQRRQREKKTFAAAN